MERMKAELEYHGLYVDDLENGLVQIEFVSEFTTSSLTVAHSDLDEIIRVLASVRDGVEYGEEDEGYEFPDEEDLIPKLPRSQVRFDP
ncbi:MAG: hypothetical protein J6K69_07055 [Candidatus Methanomethylophilaceae archaeon]|nr:hypothetical protein [Candidatus Methanomethylophilaceae archaeon]